MKNKKVALVLSGGGAKGAFQFGAIKYIEEVLKKKYDFDYSIIAGVSVGCLNGGMMSMGKYEQLKTMWSNISNDGVYTGSKKIIPILWRCLIRKKKSVLDITPLKNKIDSYFNLSDVKCKFHFGLTSLVSGNYNSLSPDNFNNDADFRNAALASATMPLVWTPVPKITLKDGTILEQCVDGGLRSISPLRDVINDEPTHVIIIDCSPLAEAPDPTAANSIVTIAERALTDITLNQVIDNDIRDFLLINNLVEQADKKGIELINPRNGKLYKQYKHVLIQPSGDLGDSLDFSTDLTANRMLAGYQAAQKAFEKKTDFLA